jgi:hypothetical protein
MAGKAVPVVKLRRFEEHLLDSRNRYHVTTTSASVHRNSGFQVYANRFLAAGMRLQLAQASPAVHQ